MFKQKYILITPKPEGDFKMKTTVASIFVMSLLAVTTNASSIRREVGACDPAKLQQKNQTYEQCQSDVYQKYENRNESAYIFELLSNKESDKIPMHYQAKLMVDKKTKNQLADKVAEIEKKYNLQPGGFFFIITGEYDSTKRSYPKLSGAGEFVYGLELNSKTRVAAYQEALALPAKPLTFTLRPVFNCDHSQNNAPINGFTMRVCSPEELAIEKEIGKLNVEFRFSQLAEIFYEADHTYVNKIYEETKEDYNTLTHRWRGWLCKTPSYWSEERCSTKNLAVYIKSGK